MINYPYGQNSIAPGIVLPSEADRNNLKVPTDSFSIYVNGRYVGEKILVAQGDLGEKAVKDYLLNQGFTDFSYTVEGKNIYIETYDEREKDMVDYLKVYLRIR
ncbi:MAG: hypothetical protein XD49_1088 [Caldanaerobacter subterraneus]|jgi:hypothetical protein|uniref:Uncharacterized protein n=4 Tax=Caldanaerobacter subterraneus TaxID=911092 RepID=Q8RB23_CALS4|nr:MULTISPECIES: hypothetical protein [Caldanaerobacter]AAM24257.1 hypothetical protein TTE1002 [Caldanaerobacter subterraneus subsp. tengcongensis MB4]ERM92108.1 hypothetical protein O163_07000 [Caldanaerobacter subterraneus subsp. yonseiensis KB-1]KKC29927.1 hypothetical protein CDSM653_01035 [Caldanaerobacter subterraneus subsp. pacificus DSM 12653]KUK08857.1 MAG: hypothetical protein XD49_1088 [Caldanaerobacter subterraneus]MBE3579735.1 hypothetical protein [Caldanaerobacter subterraneus]